MSFSALTNDASASNEAAQPLMMKAASGTIKILKTKPIKRDKRVKAAVGRDIDVVIKFEPLKLINQNKNNRLFWL
jgi:hypothetical protein